MHIRCQLQPGVHVFAWGVRYEMVGGEAQALLPRRPGRTTTVSAENQPAEKSEHPGKHEPGQTGSWGHGGVLAFWALPDWWGSASPDQRRRISTSAVAVP